MKNPWKTVKKNKVYENKFGYELWDNDVITPAGTPGKYMVLESHGFVVIVAVTKNNELVMTRQWRYPIEQESLEVSAGTLKKDEDPMEAAKRELAEETGGQSPDWVCLGDFWLANGVLKVKGHIMLALDVEITTDTNRDDTESIEVAVIPMDEVVKMILNNQITDDRTIMGVLWVKEYLDKGGHIDVQV